ncbi:MAG: hypothetical protein Q8P50_04405 [Bacillota bacterium]|nr:hypothetical protein [Bacillota bacterium]
MFIATRVYALLTAVIIVVAMFYNLNLAKKGKKLYLRRIAGLDALDECVGRAAEMGRPIHVTPGLGGLTGTSAPQILAGLEIQSYLANKCATYDVRLFCSVSEPEVLPVAQEIQKASHVAAGRPDTYREEDVRFLSQSQFAFASAIIGIIERERCVASVMIGAFAAEALFLAENSAQLGCITIGGATNLYQIPFFIAACDYTLVGEEVFVGGAYVSQDQAKIAGLRAQDIGKALTIALLIVVALYTTFTGDKSLVKILNM